MHVYHSALPLSPKLSTFHSRILREKTSITEFHERPDAWGRVVRTITAGSKRFTCMATFGHKIASSSDDGTVGIYDSVTGVLRLSLNLADHVQAIGGSPDGSVLFCAHKTPSITAWDMQTGGLVHTFVLGRNAEDVAVSLKGRYLASRLSDGSVEVWEVAHKIEGAAIWTTSPVTCFCWLEPEERLAVSTRALLRIWDIVSGTVLYSFTIRYPVHHIAYSQKFNQLAVVGSSAPENSMTIINPRAGTSTTSHWTHQNLPFFAFSQTSMELVCGMETHGLQLFNISKQRRRHIEYPDKMTSVSSLPNGTVVANFTGSGIQLLDLRGGDTASQQPTISALTVDSFDQGKIIAILPASRNYIVLLDPVTMSELLKIPAQEANTTPTYRARILWASLDRRMAVHSFNGVEKEFMQLWEFDEEHPKWTVEVDGPPSIGRVSPSGARLVVFYDTLDAQTYLSLWDTLDGQLRATLQTDPVHPLDITFDTEKQFFSHHHTYRVLYMTTRSPYIPTPKETKPAARRVYLNHFHSLPSTRGSQGGYYDVDDEWVVGSSKRICWIPPGYIRSAQPSHWWAGNSLFMAGQDETFRRLTFREPITAYSSDSSVRFTDSTNSHFLSLPTLDNPHS